VSNEFCATINIGNKNNMTHKKLLKNIKSRLTLLKQLSNNKSK